MNTQKLEQDLTEIKIRLDALCNQAQTEALDIAKKASDRAADVSKLLRKSLATAFDLTEEQVKDAWRQSIECGATSTFPNPQLLIQRLSNLRDGQAKAQ